MFPIRATLLLAVALLATVASASPAFKRAKTVNLSQLVGDVICPKGQSLFQQVNKATVPSTPAYKVWQYAGNFFQVDWQGQDLISTSGKVNHAGAIRTFSTLGLTLQEQLNFDVGTANPTKHESYFLQQFSLLGEPEVAGVKVSKVQDFFTVTQLAGNTNLYWEVVGCANVTSIAETIFDQVHGGSLDGVVKHFA